MSLFDDELYVPPVDTKLTEDIGVDALREGWRSLFGEYPSNKALAILVAQSTLETGRFKKIKNFNFGNLKRATGYEFTMFATGENIWNKNTQKTEWHWFEPPHPQTAFRSYNIATEGAKDYIKFLSDRKSSEPWRNRVYKKAFSFLKKGMPREYSYTLHKAGYYTADPERYTDGVVKLYDEFLEKINKKYGDEIELEEVVIQGSVSVEDESKPIASEPEVVEVQTFSDKKGTSKATIAIFTAGVIASIYAWLSGLF